MKTCRETRGHWRSLLLGAIAASVLFNASFAAADPAGADLDRQFRDTIRPFLEAYCISCHGPDKTKGDLDMSVYTSPESVGVEAGRWKLMMDRLAAGEMPPEKAKAHPSPVARAEVVAWIAAARKFEANRTAGDPGPVLARRLSNAELDHTIRDLTGVDIRPAREFPIDPANQAGFDNSGESLTMSPALLKKYMEAARRVSEHLVMAPDRIEFAPHPVVTDTDRDKFCVNRIIAFYKRQRLDYADFFYAAWRYEHRPKADATLDQFADEAGISPKYLAQVREVLTKDGPDVGPIAALRAMFHELPETEADARAGCERMRDFVTALRAKLVPEVKNLTAPQIERGSQPLVMEKNRQMALNRRRYAGGALKLADPGLPPNSTAARRMTIPSDPKDAKAYEAQFEAFCSTFPDAFFVSERARVFLDPKGEKDLTGRLLSAGFHMQTGFYRDDAPLYDLVLNDDQRRELDRLWDDLDYVAAGPIRQYKSFVWFDRTDSAFMREDQFNFARAEDTEVVSDPKVKLLEQRYTAKANRVGASGPVIDAIGRYFNLMSDQFRKLDRMRAQAEPLHIRSILDLAERAYRRPLTQAERDDLTAFYKSLRDQEKVTHEEALRDTLASVLMSPHFLFRVDSARPGAEAVRPLDDYSLASRLSYFLWSSLPDKPLLDLAAAGKLNDPDVLVAQARRMLKDPKVRGLATEFAGHWLDFRRFQEHNAVDRTRFPQFDDDLRAAMFDEPVRFFTHVAQADRPVLDFLYADYTFVNPALARHYGMPADGAKDNWTRVDNAGQFGRGGLLPMAVFLTKNSPGLRTSPVQRGNWLVRKLLGEYIAPPPPTVPDLPADEAKLGDLTLRETLARHRADPSCAKCHEHFDSFGLVFEGFGPIGERRSKDFAGRAVDASATFPGGGEGTGLDGLRTYIRERRQDDFLDHLCRELLAYGLARSVTLADEQLISAMKAKLATTGYRFDTLIEAIVTSPQFRNKRVAAAASPREPGK